MTEVYKNMICPYCGKAIYIELTGEGIKTDNGGINLVSEFCPSCSELIVLIEFGNKYYQDQYTEIAQDIYESKIIYPQFPSGVILDKSIPEKYKELYKQSEMVNNISPMASATLSRYLLQMLLHEELGISKRNLEEEIKELENSNNIPSKLVTLLQIMRRIANFGAHPKKSTHSNEIVEVENGESAIMLELIVELFDHIFVKPNQQQEFLNDVKEKYGIEV